MSENLILPPNCFHQGNVVGYHYLYKSGTKEYFLMCILVICSVQVVKDLV